MLVLGPVVHEQQHACRSQAVNERIEHGLSLVVDPVEVLENQEEGLLIRFSEQESPHGVDRAPPTLGGVERPPRGVVAGHVEQRQQRRQGWRQRFVQGAQRAHHLVADLAEVVTILDLEVTLKEVDHSQVARRRAVRDRGALEGEPALQTMRVGELIDEARLADPRLADDCRHLAVTAAREPLSVAELLQSESRPTSRVSPRRAPA